MSKVVDAVFPPIKSASSEGLLCVGGSFDVDRLVTAYRQGIFPWGGDPVRWFCPDPRSIFWDIHIPRKVKQLYRSGRYRVTADTAFRSVVEACRTAHGEDAAWITDSYIDAYTDLNRSGIAHSIEIWQAEDLVGGLYGIQIGSYFAGESMFHRVSNVSKVAFFVLCRHLWDLGVVLFDSQVINYHTHTLGAAQVGRSDFLGMLDYAVNLAPLGVKITDNSGQGQQDECKEIIESRWTLSSSNSRTPNDHRRRFWSFNDERESASIMCQASTSTPATDKPTS